MLGQILLGFRIIGSILSFMALIGQILYLMKRSFASHNLFDGYTAFILFRIVVILVLSIVFFVKNLIRHEVNTAELDGRSEKSKI